MRTERLLATALLASSLMLGACADQSIYERPGDSQFGEANNQTMAAQIIDPDPHYDTLVPVSSGEHAATAVKAYREDKVPEPTTGTSSSSGSLSSGSSMGSSRQ